MYTQNSKETKKTVGKPVKGRQSVANMASVSSSNIYVHSSPPKAISGQGAAIRQWVKQGDLEKLEQVVLDGQGARLLGLIDSTAEPKVKAFLRTVPSYMAKVDMIHDAVIRGSLREVQALIDKRKLATGRDAVGRGVLHKAVLYNHKNIIEYLGKKYPETLQIKDNEARTALHYSPASKDPDAMYEQLINLGAKESVDIHGRKPNYYLNAPENLDIEGPRSLSNNRSKRARLESTPIPKPISSTITRAQIRIWIHERDVGKLEKIVWSGNGDKLLLETTNNNKVKKFLLNVPHLLFRIKSIHSAAINNDVDTIKDIRSKTEIPEVFTSKDSHGLTALHKAAGLANRTIVEWFLYEFPNQLLNDQDNEGRTPLHYAAKDISTYNFLLRAGASESIVDLKGKTPAYYKKNVSELDGKYLRNVPDSPRVTGELTPWDRIVTSPGGIMDPKRRISNGEFNDEEQQPVAKKFNYDSDGYNGDTEGKYDIPEDVKIGHFDVVEVAAGELLNDDDDDFEPPIDDEDEEEKRANAKADEEKNRQKSEEEERNKKKKKSEKLVAAPVPPETLSSPVPPEENTEEEIIDQDPEPQPEPEQLEPAEDLEPEPEPETVTEEEEEEVDIEEQQEQVIDEESHQETETLEIDQELGGISDEQIDEQNLIDDSADEQTDNVNENENENLIDTEDMERLVELVLDGNGKDIVDMKSENPEVQEFITNIPAYMGKIASIHHAAASGNLRDLQAILDRKRLALAKDTNGLCPLHKAVLNGHSKVIRYLATNYSQCINAPDKNGRTPLHYAATLNDYGVIYKSLIGAGADPNAKDVTGNTPGIYLRNKDLLSHSELQSQANSSNNNMNIDNPSTSLSSEALIRKADTWQRPPSGKFVGVGASHLLAVQNLNLNHTNPVNISPKTLELLKDAYKSLIQEETFWNKIMNRLTNQNHNHISKEYIQSYLTPEIFNALAHKTTFYGGTLLDVIKFHPQAFIVAPDPHSYVVFKDLFYPVITDHARHFSRLHPKFNLSEPVLDLDDFNIPVVDTPAKFVSQVRLRLSRNIQPFPFLPLMTKENLFEVERIVRSADKSDSVLIRTNLEDLDKDKRKILESRGFWMPKAIKLSRFWPKARTFYTNEDLTKTIWVNGQDHVDIVVTSIYGKLKPILLNLHEIYIKLADSMQFHFNSNLGFLTVDPFRVGSGLKVIFTIRLPSLMKERSELASKCENQFPAIWSEEGKYLANVLGDALVKGLTQVSQERPDDPVEYLANFLRKYSKSGVGSRGQRSDSPEFEEEAIAAAASAATVTTMALNHGHHGSTLEEVAEQTEEPTTDDPGDENEEGETEEQSEEPANNNEEAQETSDEPASEQQQQEGDGENQEENNTPEEEGEKEQGEFEDETDEPMNESTTDAEGVPPKPIDVKTDDDEKELDEDDEMMRRLDDEVDEQNGAYVKDVDENLEGIYPHNDEPEEIEGAGQRDERGQSVLHFAAARPGGSQTLLAFLQNPTVNLAWRDERLKTARDVASSLNRYENVQTIDSFVVSKAMAGDLQVFENLLYDGYEHLYNIEDGNKNNIIDMAERAGQETVVNFLKTVPEFQENLENLLECIRLGDLERVKKYLQDEPKLATSMGRTGRTPLHVAVLCEEYAIVQYISTQFPEAVRKGDNLERTALHYAMGIEKVEKMARILVRQGARRVLKDIKGRQPSYYFINRDEIAILQEQEKK